MIKIPTKLFQLLVDLMQASVEGEPESKHGNKVNFTHSGELYTGVFNSQATEQAFKKGILNHEFSEDGEDAISINDRDSFISSFAAGALEASRGNGLYYADYASNQLGFVAGYQHYQERQKKKSPDYVYEDGYYCHGFECVDTGEVFRQ